MRKSDDLFLLVLGAALVGALLSSLLGMVALIVKPELPAWGAVSKRPIVYACDVGEE
jgi:hypothetical protein